MSPTVCFTSVTCAYLPRAKILAASVRKHQPDWTLWAVLVDIPPPDFDLRRAFAAFDRVLDARTLIAGDFDAWVFGHDAIAACCAVKGPMLRYLLGLGAARVVYLDPDVVLFAPLPPLGTAPILLTPHRLSPQAETPAGQAAARDAMRTGVYNLGFLSVTDEAVAFADWWTARLMEACVDDPARGLFVDQRYCDMVPALFPGAETLRDPGCNVATWNLDQRPLAFDRAGRLTAAGSLLRFMHFSKHGGAGERAILSHAVDNPVALELWQWYGAALAAERRAVKASEWHWMRDRAGRVIPPEMRAAWRERPDLRKTFADPFASGPETYGAWWDGQVAGGNVAARASVE